MGGTVSFAGFSVPAGIGSTITGVWSFLTSNSVLGIGTSAVGIGSLSLLLTTLFSTIFFAQTQSQQSNTPLGQGVAVVFTLKNDPIISSYPNYQGDDLVLQYKLTIKSGADPIKIVSINSTLKRSNSSTWSKNISLTDTEQIPANSSKEIDYSVDITGSEFIDSNIYNQVTVVVDDLTTNNTNTQTASSTIILGSPPIDKTQPYGYPANGVITTLDADIFADGHVHSSCFLNFSPCKWVSGGIDIAPRGADTTIYSTLDGEIVKAQFIRSSNPNGDVGGVIYIKSGSYVVEYMHLDESVNGKAGHVSRGQPIGKIYMGTLGATSGPHVHYQILFNNANLFFNSQSIIGKCSDGKFLPTLPVQYGNMVLANTDASCL